MTSKIRVKDSFWLLLAIIILLDPNGIFLYFLAAAAVHELGHWIVIRLCRGTVTRFEISAAGGAMQYHLPHLSVRSEVLIALGGPLFGLILWLAAGLSHHELLAGASLVLSIFNLLPIPPLDGGRALDCLFAPGHPLPQALAAFFSALILFLGIYAGICHNGWGLCLIGLLLTLERQTGLHSLRIQGKI